MTENFALQLIRNPQLNEVLLSVKFCLLSKVPLTGNQHSVLIFLFSFQMASIISSFLAYPQTISSPITREECLMETKKKKAGIRLSSSSPAMFDANYHSNENLNSLADAFANYQEKENIHTNNSFHLSQSLQSSLSELVRR